MMAALARIWNLLKVCGFHHGIGVDLYYLDNYIYYIIYIILQKPEEEILSEYNSHWPTAIGKYVFFLIFFGCLQSL